MKGNNSKPSSSKDNNDLPIEKVVAEVVTNENHEIKEKSESAIINIGKNKGIQPYSFPLDNHLAELPMFLNYEYSKNKIDVIDLNKNPSLKQLQNIEDVISKDNIERKIFKNDKNNLSRQLFMYNVGRLPRQFEQDVLNALVLLFIRKNSPFLYTKENNSYDIYTDKVFFTFYEVCLILGVEPSGFYIKKIKSAIQTLKTTQYFSFEGGVFFDKQKNSYIISREKGISWIADYDFLSAKSTKNMKNKNLNWVQFGNFMIHNLTYGYFNYLKTNPELYFQLSSGFVRQIYSYIDKNIFDMNGKKLRYIKRFFDTLQFKFALDYKYPSQFKRRLNKALDELLEYGLIVGYFYGDEVIFDKKEYCVYFCAVSVEDVIKELKGKQKKRIQQLSLIDEVAIDDEDKKDYLYIPSNLEQELLNKGLDNKSTKEMVRKYSKWDIIKYILWVDKQLLDGKHLGNPAGVLRIAIQGGYDISKGYLEIVDFVNKEREKVEKKKTVMIESLDELYNDYMNSEVEKLKQEEKDTYESLYYLILDGMESSIKRTINNKKIAKQNVKELEENLKEFIELRENSECFKESLYREIRMYRTLKSFDEFKNEYLSKN